VHCPIVLKFDTLVHSLVIKAKKRLARRRAASSCNASQFPLSSLYFTTNVKYTRYKIHLDIYVAKII